MRTLVGLLVLSLFPSTVYAGKWYSSPVQIPPVVVQSHQINAYRAYVPTTQFYTMPGLNGSMQYYFPGGGNIIAVPNSHGGANYYGSGTGLILRSASQLPGSMRLQTFRTR